MRKIPLITSRRFLARGLDDFLFILLLEFAYYREFLVADYWFLIVAWFLWIPVEALFLSTFGATLGKFLMRLRVTAVGDRPGYGVALKRSALVWGLGTGAGIPILSTVTMWFAWLKFTKNGTTVWDERSGTRVESATHSHIP